MEIPASVYVQASLGIGTVFYFVDDDLIGSVQPHYYIIVAHKDSTVVLVSASTKIQNHERHMSKNSHFPADTLLHISHGSEEFLTKDSVINCNFAKEKSVQELIEIQERRGIRLAGQASKELVEKITKGIRRSQMVIKKIQDLC